VRDDDVVDQLPRTRNQAGFQQVRPDPAVERGRVLPLLEEHGLFAAVRPEPTCELDVEQPWLVAQQRDLAAKDRVECADLWRAHPRS
jgi:hypothetical protein